MSDTSLLSRRSYFRRCPCSSWEELWEAGPYYERVAELLEDARESVILVGWQIDSRLPLRWPARPPVRPDAGTETLKRKLLRLCEEKPGLQIYLLIWDHACFYVLERERWQGRVWDELHPRIHFVFDNRHAFGASHHEKICLVDGRVGLCGGIDLCDDRWDSPRHLHHDPRRSLSGKAEEHGPYHDLAVQVSGPICAEIHRHIAARWRKISSIPFPKPRVTLAEEAPKGWHSVYLSRTLSQVSEGRGARARVIREVEFLYRDLIDRARHRIILEGQYFWSRELHDLLITKMQKMRGSGFEVVLILADLKKTRSLTRLMNSYELSLLERLRIAARQTGTRLILGNPYSHPPTGIACHDRSRAIYVHSKILVIDDEYLSIGSTNFADRALRLDTEINLTLEGGTEAERAHIRRFARELLRHWNISGPESGTRRDGERVATAVSLRQLAPGLRLEQDRCQLWLATPPAGRVSWVHWEWLFDPKRAVAWPIKRGLSRLRRRGRALTALALLGACALIASAAYVLSGIGPLQGALAPGCLRWELLELALLSQVWILPIPFVGVAALGGLLLGSLAGAPLGAELAARIAVASLWVASAVGYAAGRAFPASMARFQRRTQARRLPGGVRKRLGSRSFSSLVALLVDPRVSMRSKIALQGLACVPLPWFLLGSFALLPALFYIGLKAWVVLAPRLMIELASQFAAPVFAAVLVLKLGKVIFNPRYAAFKKNHARPGFDRAYNRVRESHRR